MTPPLAAGELAAAFRDGSWSADELLDRGAAALGQRPRWLRGLVRRVLAAFPEAGASPAGLLAEFLARDAGFRRYCLGERRPRPDVMSPTNWPVPALPTPARLADWLGLTPARLDWFADVRHRNSSAPERLRHYAYRVVRKPSGKPRLLEAPRPLLKALQRRLLHELLAHVPPHDVAHAYRPGRSVRTFAEPHAGRRLVLRLDLCDFFPSVRASRVHALFRRLGYPRPVARLLTGLCTHVTPDDAWPDTGPADWQTRRRFAASHLPQGTPTSPALANLCAWRLDARLSVLAATAGASYTRYADYLAFSGGPDFERSARRFLVRAGAVVLEEGFTPNFRKTRLMRPGVRQELAGVVVNVRPNVRRAEFDCLKATLTNCVRHGPEAQNRDGVPDFRGHLLGKVAWVASLHPERGRRLRELFNRIAWDAG